jgi:hypothetical protein
VFLRRHERNLRSRSRTFHSPLGVVFRPHTELDRKGYNEDSCRRAGSPMRFPRSQSHFEGRWRTTSLKRLTVLSPYCTSLLFATGELPGVSPDLPRYHGRAVLGLSPAGKTLGANVLQVAHGVHANRIKLSQPPIGGQDAGEPETVAGKSSSIDHSSGAGPLASVSLTVGVTCRPSVLGGSCWALEAWMKSTFCQYALVLTPFTICRER